MTDNFAVGFLVGFLTCIGMGVAIIAVLVCPDLRHKFKRKRKRYGP